MLEVFERLQEQFRENKSTVLVTIVDAKGSTPGKVGFKMLTGPDGRIYGTIGGGGVEFHAINMSRELIEKGEKNLKETIILKEEKQGDKTATDEKGRLVIPALCGGEVTLFYEVYMKAKTLYIFGAGHVGQAVSRIAKTLQLDISLFDFRKEILDDIPQNIYNRKILVDFSSLASSVGNLVELDSDGFALIMTHNHVHDLQVLEYLYRHHPDLKYIGMIGSKKKVKEAVAFLKEKFGDDTDLKNLYAPVGIDLGGDTPEEIAISIVAEIQAVMNGKQVPNLRITNL